MIRRKVIKVGSYVYMYIKVCSDHYVCGKPYPLYETRNPDWVPALRLGHNDSKLTGNTSINMTGHPLELIKGKGCELFDNEIHRRDNEEENVQREAVQSGVLIRFSN